MVTNFNYQDRFTDMDLKQLALEFLDLHEFAFQENFKTPGLSGKDHNVDFVVVGQKGLGGFKGKVLGSVANSILHESNVSVFLVK